METLIGEKIKVLSLFENGRIKPVVFLWRKRTYRVLQTVFCYSKKTGKEKIFFFSVKCRDGAYELSFNQDKFSWEISKTFSS